jgi:hypothetical protein
MPSGIAPTEDTAFAMICSEQTIVVVILKDLLSAPQDADCRGPRYGALGVWWCGSGRRDDFARRVLPWPSPPA